MDNSSFDSIMQTITSGLTDDPAHDLPYLREQCEAYKDHPLSNEILRACGRLIWDLVPKEKLDALGRLMENDRKAVDTTLDEVMFNLKMGNQAKALELIEPLANKHARLMDEGWGQDDSQSVYFDFKSPIEEAVWAVNNEGEHRTVRKAPAPYAQVFFFCASCLYEAGRFDEAIAYLHRAIRWNPGDAILRFELGENYKRMGDITNYDCILDELYPYITSPADLARFHRAKGYVSIERGLFELAAAHLVMSTFFEQSTIAQSELMFIKTKHGADYTDMMLDDAARVLKQNDQPIGASPHTVGGLVDLLRIAADHDDVETTYQLAKDLYGLTGDEVFANIARRISDMVKGEGTER